VKKWIYICLLLLLTACHQNKYDNPHILIVTNFGDIEAELFPGKAPKTVAAFLNYVNEGLYNPASFYRVIKNENLPSDYNMGFIQGGIIKTNPQKQLSLAGIPHESPKQTGLSHTDGTLSLARTKPGTGSSEFFICIGDQTQFDGNNSGEGYAAFGRVVTGMKAVHKIQNQKSIGDSFVTPIVIKKIKQL